MVKQLNALGQALNIVESGKYNEDKAIMAIMESLKTTQTMLDIHIYYDVIKFNELGYYPFKGYVQGCKGEYKYSTNIYAKEYLSGIETATKTAFFVNEIHIKGECLIMALNALGEEIEY